MNNSTLAFLTPTLLHSQASQYLYAGVAVLLGIVVYNGTKTEPHLARIPSVGGTGFFSSWLGALRTARKGHEMVKEGYSKYNDRTGVFRVPLVQRWQVLVTSSEHIEELARAPEDVLSLGAAHRETFAGDYTLDRRIFDDRYHVPVLRNVLTRNLANIFEDMHDELVHAFEDYIPLTDDWSKAPAYSTCLKIVGRTANRIFVGLPKCRDPEYLELTSQFTLDVTRVATIVNMVPYFLRSLAGKLFTRVPQTLGKTLKHLQPIIHERQQKIMEYGADYPDKPNDLLSWFMDAATGEELSAKNLTMRILVTNFAALHTSTMTLVHSLYHLAVHPEYVESLRDEIEVVLGQEGWTKGAVSRMRKLDSFLKESLRTPGLSSVTSLRKAQKAYTFSDGLHIPKGTSIAVATSGRNHNEEVYQGGTAFDGLRFSNLGEDAKNSAISTNLDWLAFGHGHHACPGRFFATAEVKTMLAHIIFTYDVKMENEGVRPPDQCINFARMPNTTAEVLFRKRQFSS